MNNEDLKIPNHLAIIVDGNGRWAKAHGKSRSMGHKAGFERLEKLVQYAVERGVQYVSLYVFSTENFKRSKDEVDFLMNLFTKNLKRTAKRFNEENIKVVFSGRREPLKDDVWKARNEMEELTKTNTRAVVNFCLNYGGHAEIVDACKKIATEVTDGSLMVDEITEELFSHYLYHDLPPVDLMIRTSGELRISNFLLWQLAYAEMYFPKVTFPDFDEAEFEDAILVYNGRDRRYGGIDYSKFQD